MMTDRFLNHDLLARTCAALIPVLPRLVERPWGGSTLPAYKGVDSAKPGAIYGEAFEVSAWDADPETAANPSLVRLSDGAIVPLTALLDVAGETILGTRLASAHGCRIPLLPKVLCVRELLSVQAHPPGRPEVYVVLEAEQGATLRLGWRGNVEAQELGRRLAKGRELQVKLAALVSPKLSEADLGRLISSRLGSGADHLELCAGLFEVLGPTNHSQEIEDALRDLRELYWHVLDLLCEVEARQGQVIYNATSSGEPRFPDAEVHALGNPLGKELLCLEVRLPGTTYRAWDHCRYPLRPVDVSTALSSMPLKARSPESFIAKPSPLAGYPGVSRSVENGLFVIDHVELRGAPVRAPAGSFLRTLHGVDGKIVARSSSGEIVGELGRGQCAIVPASLGDIVFEATCGSLIQVTVPS
jgi:hypothetical protein